MRSDIAAYLVQSLCMAAHCHAVVDIARYEYDVTKKLA